MAGLHEAEDLYHILGLPSNVSPDKIKEQFRFLVQAFHPDKHSSPAHKARAEEMLRKITDAYRVLSDPLQRAAYDKRRTRLGSIFEEQGAFERERTPGVAGARANGHSAGARQPAVARKLIKRFQQGYVCSDCGGEVRESARFCLHCGKTFTTADAETAGDGAPVPLQAQKIYSKLRGVWNCSNCRGVVQPQSSFCIHCGQSFGKAHS